MAARTTETPEKFFFRCFFYLRETLTAPRSTENAPSRQGLGLEAHNFSEFTRGGRARFS